MAVWKTTKKAYPEKFEQGLLNYHKTEQDVLEICGKYSYEFYSRYEMIKFATDNTVKYFDKRHTWAWFKCFMPAKFVEKIIQECLSDYVEHYAICTHDRDTADIHTHVILKFYRNESYTTKILAYFHCDNISDCVNKVSNCWAYLRHDSKQCRKEGKFQYSYEDVITDDREFFDNFVVDDKNCCELILEDINNGVKEKDLVKRYGRDYIIYRQRYHDSAFVVRQQGQPKIATNLKVVSITDGILALYNEKTGELVEIARSYADMLTKVKEQDGGIL